MPYWSYKAISADEPIRDKVRDYEQVTIHEGICEAPTHAHVIYNCALRKLQVIDLQQISSYQYSLHKRADELKKNIQLISPL